MAKILDGKVVRDAHVAALTEEIAHYQEKPVLVIIQVGDRPDSNSYIRQKKLFAEKVGARVIHEQHPEVATQDDIVKSIEQYNHDKQVHGIIIQLPVPEHLKKDELINAIDTSKDVDGLTDTNTKLFLAGDAQAFIPATAKGVLALLRFYEIEISGKKVTVIGNSDLVGKPIATGFAQQGGIITICDIKNTDLVPFTKPADIIVVATGHAHLITQAHVSAGQTVIDVGITVYEYDGKRRLVGDVDFEQVEPIVGAISPVPGGVGPMTVTALFENLVLAYKKR
jgi:methylenetetrahydrofolate dehydrogenase (NADP+)/methenyltetrahydrofolate cyclohydrolase